MKRVIKYAAISLIALFGFLKCEAQEKTYIGLQGYYHQLGSRIGIVYDDYGYFRSRRNKELSNVFIHFSISALTDGNYPYSEIKIGCGIKLCKNKVIAYLPYFDGQWNPASVPEVRMNLQYRTPLQLSYIRELGKTFLAFIDIKSSVESLKPYFGAGLKYSISLQKEVKEDHVEIVRP